MVLKNYDNVRKGKGLIMKRPWGKDWDSVSWPFQHADKISGAPESDLRGFEDARQFVLKK